MIFVKFQRYFLIKNEFQQQVLHLVSFHTAILQS